MREGWETVVGCITIYECMSHVVSVGYAAAKEMHFPLNGFGFKLKSVLNILLKAKFFP